MNLFKRMTAMTSALAMLLTANLACLPEHMTAFHAIEARAASIVDSGECGAEGAAVAWTLDTADTVRWEMPTRTVDNQKQLVNMPIVLYDENLCQLPVAKAVFDLNYDYNTIGLYTISGDSDAYQKAIHLNAAIMRVTIGADNTTAPVAGTHLSNVMDLNFQIPENCPLGKYIVSIENLTVYDKDGNDISAAVKTVDGVINVVEYVETTTTDTTTSGTTTTTTSKASATTTTTTTATTTTTTTPPATTTTSVRYQCGIVPENNTYFFTADDTTPFSKHPDLQMMFNPILRIDRIFLDESGKELDQEQLPNQSLFEIARLSDIKQTPASLFAESNALEHSLSYTLYEKEFTEFIRKTTIMIDGAEVPLSDIVDSQAIFKTSTSVTFDTPVMIAPRGDISLDTKIDSIDAQRVLLIYAESMASGDENLIYHESNPALAKLAADVDQNGVVDVADAQYILIYYAYLLSEEPNLSWDMIITE